MLLSVISGKKISAGKNPSQYFVWVRHWKTWCNKLQPSFCFFGYNCFNIDANLFSEKNTDELKIPINEELKEILEYWLEYLKKLKILLFVEE